MTEPKLSLDEFSALKEIGRPLPPKLDPAIRDNLIKKGLVSEKLGNLTRTSKGNLYLHKHG